LTFKIWEFVAHISGECRFAFVSVWLFLPVIPVGIPVDRDRSFWFVVTGDSGLS